MAPGSTWHTVGVSEGQMRVTEGLTTTTSDLGQWMVSIDRNLESVSCELYDDRVLSSDEVSIGY